jgi:hypothetical protein
MKIDVRHGLTSHLAHVDTDIEGRDWKAEGDGSLCGQRGGSQLGALFVRRVEPARDVPSRHDVRVAFTCRQGVPKPNDELAFVEDGFDAWVTERTLFAQ